jgi:AcrR family transcriptional regulator
MRTSRAEAKQNNRKALLAAARDLIASDGASVSLDTIAAAADLTTGAVYSIFGSKRDLLIALLAEDIERHSDAQSRLSAPELSLRQVLRGSADAWLRAFGVDFLTQVTFELQLILLATHDQRLRDQLDAAKGAEVARLTELLTNRVVEGGSTDRRTTRKQAHEIAFALRALLSGLAVQQVMLSEQPRPQLVRDACESLVQLADKDHR